MNEDGASGPGNDDTPKTANVEAKIAAQAEMLANRLRKRQRHLRKWARRTGTAVYRLYDRDIPEIPLVFDWISGTRDGVPCNALTGALFKRPYEKDEDEEAVWLAAMKTAAAQALEIEEGCIFLKERRHTFHHGQDDAVGGPGGAKSGEQYGKLAERGFTMDVREGGLNFRLNLSDYLDTGLFPDRRLLRAKIRDEAGGKRVLNLFAYTCAFSVYAAGGGAASVDSLDLSRTYLERGMLNFELNGFKGIKAAPWDLGAKTGNLQGRGLFRFIRGDALRFLPEAKKEGLCWDLIILDPPTFSNSKKMRGSMDIKRDYAELINRCLSLLAPQGKLFVSVNARSFKIDRGDFSGIAAGMEIVDLTEQLRDEDFRDRRIPACYVLE
jgi:23S rRNA G2069 N7-methylase RlmK/C1962 C5-methylase RlmI